MNISANDSNSSWTFFLPRNTSDAVSQPSDGRIRMTPLFVALYCVAGMIVIPGILGNGIIVYVVTKVKKMRTPTNYLVSSLAIADLMMMVTMVAFLGYVLQTDINIPKNVNTFLFPSLDVLVGSASIGNLAAVSVDRALAVLYPLRYLVIVTTRRVRYGIRCIWCYSFIMFVCGMVRIEVKTVNYQDGFIYAAYTCSFVLPLIIIACCYAAIIFSAITSLRMTNSLEKSSSVSLCNDAELKREVTKRRRRARLREIKVAMNFMVILVPFLGGWGFFFGLQFYELFTNTIVQNDLQEWFLYVIPWLNSSINPVVYICLNRPLRKECGKVLCNRFRLNRAWQYRLPFRWKSRNIPRSSEDNVLQSENLNRSKYVEYDPNESFLLKGTTNEVCSNGKEESVVCQYENHCRIDEGFEDSKLNID